MEMIPQEERQERIDEIARKAYENGLWPMEAAMTFRQSHIKPENIPSWERTIDMAIRAKKKSGVKYINLDLFHK